MSNMHVHQLPGYHIESDTMLDRYAEAIRSSVDTKESLFEHIDKWRGAWELWARETDPSIPRILNHEISDSLLEKLRKSMSPDFIPKEDDADDQLICNLLLPPSFLLAMLVAKKFDIPFCTALHQSLCKLEDHSPCF